MVSPRVLASLPQLIDTLFALPSDPLPELIESTVSVTA
jgi:hypothetical protein